MGYGSASSDLDVLRPEKGLSALPGSVDMQQIDLAFPDNVSVKKNQGGKQLVHLCHLDEEAEKVGCPGVE